MHVVLEMGTDAIVAVIRDLEAAKSTADAYYKETKRHCIVETRATVWSTQTLDNLIDEKRHGARLG